MAEETIAAQVGGRTIALSRLDKVLFPQVGLTKGEVMAYYQAIAPVLLPHLRDRIVTRIRYPDGVDGVSFFEKNAPAGAPEWLRTQLVHHDEDTRYVMVEDPATLAWLSNLAALELHVPQWRLSDATLGPDGGVAATPEPRSSTVVIDLDPGTGITMVELAHAAALTASLLASDGLVPHVKTSGSKGLQVYAGIEPTPAEQVVAYVKEVGTRAVRAEPELFVLVQTRSLRDGRILIDYLQNKAARTTVAPYSIRGRPRATVSTPVTWDEIGAVTASSGLAFTPDEVLARVARHGDLFADLLEEDHPPLPLS